MVYEDDYQIVLVIPCDCGTEQLEIHQWSEGDNSDYDLLFKIDSFVTGQSVLGILKRRIKLAWLALRKGNYIHQDICLTRKSLEELKNNIEELLEKGDKNV